MRKDLYADLYHKERNYWWLKAKRNIVKVHLPSNSGLKTLDIGCGAGQLVYELSKKHQAFGIDKSAQAVKFCKKRGLKNIYQDNFPLLTKTYPKFDIITALDVLEHIENDQQAIIVIKKLLKKNGRLILTVPAYPWLFSYWDKILMHKRRYTKKGLARIVKKSGLEIEKISFCFSFLLPPVIPFRLIRGQMFKNQKPKSDFIALPRSLHSILFLMSRFEHFLLRYISLPFGLSLVVVAQKK